MPLLTYLPLLALIVLLASTAFGLTEAANPVAVAGQAIGLSSFAAGVFCGAGVVWLWKLPWSKLAEFAAALLLVWQRNSIFLALALGCASVLIFY